MATRIRFMGLVAATALLAVLVLELSSPAQETAQDAERAQDAAAAKRKRLKDTAADFWIYDDLRKGETLAAETGKPLLISFRCVP